MNILRRSTAILVLGAVGCFADVEPPRKLEGALRARVKEFYTLMVQKKFREAEKFVAQESRDTYYNQEKPLMKDFVITGVQWDKGLAKADVNLTSEVTVRRAVMGQFEVRVPFASHWELQHGQWVWFVPTVYARSTPFGIMRVDEKAAKASGLDIDAMIAKGPKAPELQSGVTVDINKLAIPEAVDSTGVATLKNTLPGVVHLYTQVITTAGVTAKLSRKDLGFGDVSQITVRRTAPPKQGSVVYVLVDPTGQSIPISIEVLIR